MNGYLVSGFICTIFWMSWAIRCPREVLDSMMFRDLYGLAEWLLAIGTWVFFLVMVVTLAYIALLLNQI